MSIVRRLIVFATDQKNLQSAWVLSLERNGRSTASEMRRFERSNHRIGVMYYILDLLKFLIFDCQPVSKSSALNLLEHLI